MWEQALAEHMYSLVDRMCVRVPGIGDGVHWC